MQLANVTVAIAGDTGNTVQKFGVTASEIAILRVIHGEDAVTDIEIVGSDKMRSNRVERERLALIYGATKDENNNSYFAILFPGAAARMFVEVAELELPDTFFKAATRMSDAVEQVPLDPVAAAEAEAERQFEQNAIAAARKTRAERLALEAEQGKAVKAAFDPNAALIPDRKALLEDAAIEAQAEPTTAEVEAIEQAVENDGIGDMPDATPAAKADVLS